MSILNEIIHILKRSLFPNRCRLCSEIIDYNKIICDECLSARRIDPPLCLKCGCKKSECICKRERHKPEYRSVVAPYYYEDSIARGVLSCKMNDLPDLTKTQGASIAQTVKKYYGPIQFDCVTYIPMRRYDERYRGYNQSELLAARVSEICGIPLKPMLYKKRRTKIQKRQKASNRYVNMYNAFDLLEDADADGKNILLIDDVKTTGATLSSAALTLKAYGAKAVYCAVFAIVK